MPWWGTERGSTHGADGVGLEITPVSWKLKETEEGEKRRGRWQKADRKQARSLGRLGVWSTCSFEESEVARGRDGFRAWLQQRRPAERQVAAWRHIEELEKTGVKCPVKRSRPHGFFLYFE